MEIGGFSIKEKYYKEIDKVSSSFCLAKWLQVTIDLQHGTNHSCHHPKRHLIPKELLEEDPGVLHNTPFKKEQRKKMLEGVRPPECSYCWNVEDTSGTYFSDRYIKSTDDWAYPSLNEVKNLEWDKSINPTYIEVMFDSNCNLSCSYCAADISTSIEKEMKEFGPYGVSDSTHRMPENEKEIVKDGEENSYQKAFWRWLPTLKKDLKVLRITGGEPLLSKQNDKLLDYFDQNPHPNLTLVINSNLSLPKVLVENFLSKIEKLLKEKKVGNFELYTSLDGLGPQSAYIRSGLNEELFWKNIDLVIERFPSMPLVIMCTFNILSIGSIENLLERVLNYKKEGKRLILDMSCLHNPGFLRVNILTKDLFLKLEKAFSFMKMNTRESLFSEHELSKFESVYNWAKVKPPMNDLLVRRRDFYSFIIEYDRRKKTDFLKIFPEYNYLLKTSKKVLQFTKIVKKVTFSS